MLVTVPEYVIIVITAAESSHRQITKTDNDNVRHQKNLRHCAVEVSNSTVTLLRICTFAESECSTCAESDAKLTVMCLLLKFVV